MENYLNRNPFELSLGEKQRIAISGELAINPDYYIFDENTYTLTGEDTGRTFKLGEHVRIIVKDVDFLAKAVNFMLEDSIFAEGEM